MQIDTYIMGIIDKDIFEMVIESAMTAWARESLLQSVTKNGRVPKNAVDVMRCGLTAQQTFFILEGCVKF